jgi:hypothetical protein
VIFSAYSGFLSNKTEHHYITEILLTVALSTIKPNQIKDIFEAKTFPFPPYSSSFEKTMCNV